MRKFARVTTEMIDGRSFLVRLEWKLPVSFIILSPPPLPPFYRKGCSTLKSSSLAVAEAAVRGFQNRFRFRFLLRFFSFGDKTCRINVLRSDRPNCKKR